MENTHKKDKPCVLF